MRDTRGDKVDLDGRASAQRLKRLQFAEPEGVLEGRRLEGEAAGRRDKSAKRIVGLVADGDCVHCDVRRTHFKSYFVSRTNTFRIFPIAQHQNAEQAIRMKSSKPNKFALCEINLQKTC